MSPISRFSSAPLCPARQAKPLACVQCAIQLCVSQAFPHICYHLALVVLWQRPRWGGFTADEAEANCNFCFILYRSAAVDIYNVKECNPSAVGSRFQGVAVVKVGISHAPLVEKSQNGAVDQEVEVGCMQCELLTHNTTEPQQHTARRKTCF